MDVFASNSSRLNTKRIHKVDEKSVVFITAAPFVSTTSDEIEFPYDGVLKKISVSCKTAGITKSRLTLQRCSAPSYVAASPNWEDINTSTVDVLENAKVAHLDLSNLPHIKAGDFLRILFQDVGAAAAGFVVRVDIILNIEE